MRAVARSRTKAKGKGKKFKRFVEKNRCRFCRAKVEYVDYKDVQTLQRYTTAQGKMLSRKRSGTCARHQRRLKSAVKYARYMALQPYVAV